MHMSSPQNSFKEDQLRLDLIDEEDYIDELLKGTRNFWNRDEEKIEKIYDRKDVIDLEQEKIQLIAQCTKLEQETDFLSKLYKLGR